MMKPFLSYLERKRITDEDVIWYKIVKDIYVWDLTKMETLFGPIEDWNTSWITNMKNLFAYCCFDRDISHWDVSNVKNMESMFCKNYSFNQPLDSWDVSNVKYETHVSFI